MPGFLEIASDWKSTFIKLTVLFRLARLLGLFSLALCTTELLVSFAQKENLLAPGNQTWVFSCPCRSVSA